jgi:CRP-like cAMP-binding protein
MISHDPLENHILGALPAEERARLFPHLTLAEMPLGMVLYESGHELRHMYFPTDSIVSLLYVMRDGASAEIAVVGNEGAIGVALFMGGETTPSRAIVQSAGFAYRVTGQRLKDEFNRHGEMLHVLTQELIANMLGVRREGVTVAAGKLQDLGAIKYRRGRITVLDRPKLEALSCECYDVVKRETDRLLHPHAQQSSGA